MIKAFKPASEFSRSVLTLLTGTSVAQAIPIAISPILTRLYTPEEFGIFAIYVSFAGFLAIFATLRYEYAIVLPKKKSEVDSLCIGTILIISTISLLLLLVIIFFGKEIASALGSSEMIAWIYLVPLSVFFLGIYNALNYRLLWLRHYKFSASGKVVMSGSNALSNLSMGSLGLTKLGLILGNFASYLISAAYVFKKNKNAPIDLREVNSTSIYAVLKKYKSFPFENLPSAVINGLYNNGKLILISLFVSSSFVGYLSLVLRVLQIPVTVVSSAISDALYKNSAEEINVGNIWQLRSRIRKLLLILMGAGSVPFALIYTYGEEVFSFIFGAEWAIAGNYASVMSLGLYSMFCASPLTKVLWALEMNKWYFYWEISRLALVSIPLACIGVYGSKDIYIVWSLTGGLSISYVVLVMVVFTALGRNFSGRV
ncbi:MAG: lipopolysaccharide biosynthesis protein [Marinobacter sp.]|uniref:lipopolysaccharide biosynthesis protein n=1 Tax=Marinobacter sp. TaxID=50741 RepID=UPI0032D93837|tara:strand:- start:3324 stop:4607 length:1284 start_codon:yes stop_codon:yes gene_type:complete